MDMRHTEPITLDEASRRLAAYAANNSGLHKASTLAGVIWPDHTMRSQGAGGSAARILKRLGIPYRSSGGDWGYDLSSLVSCPNK